MKEITIPDGVKEIPNGCFHNCYSLARVTLPNSLTAIQSNAFGQCSALSSMNWPSSLKTIGERAFCGCGSLREVTLPQSLTSIGARAFKDCSALREMKLPWRVTNIGEYAFEGCSGLTDMTIPGNVKCVPMGLFKNCVNLKSVVLERGVNEIMRGAFEGCDALESAVIPGTVWSLDYTFLRCANLTSVTLGEGIEQLSGAFYGCTNLKEITIPDSVYSIGSGAFYGCHELQQVRIPDGVNALGYSAFADCVKLTSVVLPESLTSIGYDAFAGCSMLEEITVPSNCTEIDEYAFAGCTALKRIALPEGLESIAETAFTVNEGSVIYCYEYSYADFWAMDHGFNVVYLDSGSFADVGTIKLPAVIELTAGESTTIVPQIFPLLGNLTYQWSSANPAVASVDGTGLVTALDEGDTTITLCIDGLEARTTVHVRASTITFVIPQEIWMISKSSEQLPVTDVIPETAIAGLIYRSSNTTVAVVDSDGNISAKQPGDAVITVTAENGYNKRCTVHVCYPVTAIRFDRESITALPGVCVQMKALVTTRTKEWENQFVTFASSNESVAVVDPETGKVTTVGQGTSEISAETETGIRGVCTLRCVTCEEPTNQMTFPAGMATVAEESFCNVAAQEIILPAGVKHIEALAFADCSNLVYLNIPEGMSYIAPDAFDGCEQLMLLCADGSYGETYARENGISYILAAPLGRIN